MLSPEQLEFLKPFLAEFKELQLAGKGLTAFWERLYHKFYLVWPNQQAELEAPAEPKPPKLTKGGKISKRQVEKETPPVMIYSTMKNWKDARESQIRSYYYNRTTLGRKKGQAKVNIVVAIGKKDRVLAEHQLYSKKYYADRVKAKVDTALAKIDDVASHIKVTAQILKESWDQETKEIRDEIQAEHKRLVQEKKEKDKTLKHVLEGKGQQDISPEERAIVQEAIPELLESFCEAMAAKTGWAFSVIGGGPMAANTNAPIRVCTFHEGVIPETNQTFRGWYPEFDKLFSIPFSTFAHSVFPEAVRLRGAVNIELEKVTSPAALLESGRLVGHLQYARKAGEEEAAMAVMCGYGAKSQTRL
ncbi:hypothetical protein DFP72DRAFT_1069042 [Ephemerocybe angulata]|uniref:Uncharacterized protein n=1 Tax=Ephemerocybe angulata TaxID=980116 RepID=A0A8H6HV86_9AGAR|nr:hypothetical protein DFP72DRAFT_1069042 [Tulosesus angulatus]